MSEPTGNTSPPVADELDARVMLRWMRLSLLVVLAVLIGLLVFIGITAVRLLAPLEGPKADSLPPNVEWEFSIYGWGDKEVQQLIGPSDVAVDSAGGIWVCDPQRWQVLGFWPDGRYRQIIHQGPGRMMPQVIAIDDNDEIYVGDTLNGEIRVFGTDNRERRSWTTSMPTEVAVRDGKVVVGTVNGLMVYTTQGRLIKQWRGRGAEEADFDVVRGIAIGGDGTIYISDTHNQRVKAYDLKRGFLWAYPAGTALRTASDETTASGAGLYHLPTGLDFDSAGRLLMVDPFLFRINVIDPKNGHLVKMHGSYGVEDGRFMYPASLDYDPTLDRVVVADTGNDRVQVLRVAGTSGDSLVPLRRALAGPVNRILVPVVAILVLIGCAVWVRELWSLVRNWLKGRRKGGLETEDL